MNIVRGLIGIFTIFLIAYIASYDRKKIKWRPVIVGFALQFLLAFLTMRTEVGTFVLLKMSGAANEVIAQANEGIKFLFGGMYTPESNIVFVMAFNVLPIIIFFSSLIALLYHIGVMQLFIKYLGGGFAKLLGTGKAESISAAANIFLGQTEAPLLIKPYISTLTKSEMFAVMTGGLASVAGSVLAAYASFGVPMKYLITGSFMAAPSGLVLAKLMMPETENLIDKELTFDRGDAANFIDAAAKGAMEGLRLAAIIGGMLIAFVSLISLANTLIGGITGLFGMRLTLQQILGYVFSPLSFAMGVPWKDAITAGGLLGQKMILNEFVAYVDYSHVMTTLSDKTRVIMSFALLGFANMSSLALLIGGLGGMAPNRRTEIATVGMRAVLAGFLASMLNGVIAGMLYVG
ncbi:concentrative nucleoside transporter, CNT family [Cetobacterium ceti]|uniref:Concentrative nucleoside transporter, CNT family n=1 Tax=Cetobacterium ceti TaxID=180163 RepID=A0A1T4MTZ2_9FUSO|nr:concentrative nucleoside transporter, CNT family [Cetobacterium ceti]